MASHCGFLILISETPFNWFIYLFILGSMVVCIHNLCFAKQLLLSHESLHHPFFFFYSYPYNIWVISLHFPHPTPTFSLYPLTTRQKQFALISNFVEKRV
jgi:hypothetical protein